MNIPIYLSMYIFIYLFIKILYCLFKINVQPFQLLKTPKKQKRNLFIYSFIKTFSYWFNRFYIVSSFFDEISLSGTSSSRHPANDAAFPRWTAIEILSKMFAVSSFSHDDSLILRPNSERKFAMLIGPCVSTATGMKKYLDVSSRYLSAFRMAACSAAALAF